LLKSSYHTIKLKSEKMGDIEVHKERYFKDIADEYVNITDTDLKFCINTSLREYFKAKKAFIVKDNIYIKIDKNFQILQKNAVQSKRFKKILQHNFLILSKIKQIKGISKNNLIHNEIVFSGVLSYQNDEFSLYDIYFKDEKIEDIKSILYHEKIVGSKKKCLMERKKIALVLDFENIKLHENILIFETKIITKEIIIFELSKIFNYINKNLTKKISYKLISFNLIEDRITIKIYGKITKKLLESIKERIALKICMDLKLSYKKEKS